MQVQHWAPGMRQVSQHQTTTEHPPQQNSPTLQLSFFRARMVFAKCMGLKSVSLGMVTRKYSRSHFLPGVYCQQANAHTISLSAALRRWLSFPLDI